MTGFSTDWLALREPFDHVARSASSASLDLCGAAKRLRRGARHLEVIDLACGTGANLRELAPRLGRAQRWLLVDHDRRLLDALPDVLGVWAQARGFTLRPVGSGTHISGPDWDAEVQSSCADLADLDAAFDSVPFEGTHLVTASALLDLVSAEWLGQLIAKTAPALDMRRPALFFALNVDGHVAWDPAVPGDGEIEVLFAAHQLGDKGFGAALGCAVSTVVMPLLASMGYMARQAASDWRIDARDGPQAVAMIRAMVEGAGAAALEQNPAAAALVSEWKVRRLALAGETRLIVGHQDVLAMP